jgi:uncharacterized protein
MKVYRSSNASDFLRRTESWLLQSEPENNRLLGIARRFCDEPAGPDFYWADISQGRKVAGAVFRTPPYTLTLSNLPLEAVSVLVEDVVEMYASLPGVSGPNEVAKCFAQLWTDRFGGSSRVAMRQRIHALTALNEPTQAPAGALRRMEPSDAELILEWMEAFVRETAIIGPAERFARPHLQRRNFYLWDDNGSKSVAAVVRDSPNGACLSAVFTPPAYRRKGYATAAVSALSAMLLSSGKRFCCLYTDLANPISNSIYAKVGYRPVRDDAIYAFDSSCG